ncbi:unnamed protein product [Tenebrio molitor]|nr:unnamed protein product [Tenebrio molitor]
MLSCRNIICAIFIVMFCKYPNNINLGKQSYRNRINTCSVLNIISTLFYAFKNLLHEKLS